ncbi:MAG TPA: acetoacetate decarboxylase family protein [Acidimicrobiales bacterium]
MEDETTVWGMIDTEPILFPLVVDDFNAATIIFPVPAAVARTLVTGDAFEVVESAPGTAQLVVAAVEYRQGPWGPYNGLNVGPRVHPAGAPHQTPGAFLLPGPVNRRFSYEAAHRALGMPMSMGDIEVERTDDRVTFSVSQDGERAVTLRFPRVRSDLRSTPIDTVAYMTVDEVPFVVPIEFGMPTGLVDPGDLEVELGTGWLADVFRGLRLPCAPDVCLWGEGLSATFHMGQEVRSRGTRAVARLRAARATARSGVESAER